jgi:hypothetical protein
MASEQVSIPRLSATARPLAISRCHKAGATALVPDNEACFARVAEMRKGLSKVQPRATEVAAGHLEQKRRRILLSWDVHEKESN